MSDGLVTILSRFGCKENPCCTNLQRLLHQVAEFAFCISPIAAIHGMKSGVPETETDFWRQKSVDELYDLYKALSATPSRVISNIEEPVTMNPNEERVYGYLLQAIGNMRAEELRCFLRFTTGSSVMMESKIKVLFNNLDGLARRPIAHTCSSSLELPATYLSFTFSLSLSSHLSSQVSWCGKWMPYSLV